MSSVWHSLAADVVRFLRDPLDYRARDAAPAKHRRNGIDLGGAHLAHAMQAQHLALRGDHHGAIEAMRSARAACLSEPRDPVGSESQGGDALHRDMLAALADAFIAGLSLRAGSMTSADADQHMRSALERRPDLPYLHRQRAELLGADGQLDIDRLEQALAAREAAHALDSTQGALDDALFTVDLLLRAPDGGLPESFRERVERGFVGPLFDGRPIASEEVGAVAADLKRRSPRTFDVDVTESRVEALVGKWNELRNRMDISHRRAELRDATSGALDVRKVAAAVAGGDDLPTIAAAIAPPPPWPNPVSPRSSRIVLELPSWLMPDDAAFARMIGTPSDGANGPTWAALQDELRRRFGIALPGVLYFRDGRTEPPKTRSAAVSVVLDRRRLATEVLPPEPRFRLGAADAEAAVVSASRTPWEWFGHEVLPAEWPAPDFDAMLLVNVLAQRELLGCLDAFVGHATLDDLGLTDVDPELATTLLQLLRSLASERTPLSPLAERRDTLLEWAHGCREGSRSRIDAVEALRETVAETAPLWGAEPGRRRCEMPTALQDALSGLNRNRSVVQLLEPAARDAVLQWAHAELDGPRRVVFVDAPLRPWVRALLRARWPDVPVLARGPL